MGISFKISRTGTRYRPRLSQLPDIDNDENLNEKFAPSKNTQDENITIVNDLKKKSFDPKHAEDPTLVVDDVGGYSVSSANLGRNQVSQEHEVSFFLNLFHDGFSISPPTERRRESLLRDVPKHLLPYTKEAENVFSAIEYGWLPGGGFDNVPCKYVNGTILCQVVDYRHCVSKQGDPIPSGNENPVVHKVRLQMCMENVVKDIPSILDDSWNYDDLLKFESLIVKALKPDLCLDTNPSLDKLCSQPDLTEKLNLGVCRRQKRGGSDISSVKLISDNGQSISTSRLHDNSKPLICTAFGDKEVQSLIVTDVQYHNIGQGALRQPLSPASQPNCRLALSSSGFLPRTSTISSHFVSPPGQDITNSYTDLTNSGGFLLGKRDRGEGHSSSGPISKKPKQKHLGLVQQQFLRSQMDTLFGTDQWKAAVLHHELEAEKIRIQRHLQMAANGASQPILEGVPKLESRTPSCLEQKGAQYSGKHELTGIGKLYKPAVEKNKNELLLGIASSNSNRQQLQCHQLSPLLQSHCASSTPCSNVAQSIERDLKKGSISPKRNSSESQWVSSLTTFHSPSSLVSGETSIFPQGAICSTYPAIAVVELHNQKATSTSVHVVGTDNAYTARNDSVLQEPHALLPGKRKSTLPKTPRTNLVQFPVSVSNMNAPVTGRSPSMRTSHVPPPSETKGPSMKSSHVPPPSRTNGNPAVLRSFQAIGMVTQRYKLNYKNDKVDDYPERKRLLYSPQLLGIQLSKFEDSENFKDDTSVLSLSKSLLGGSINVCKARILAFLRRGGIYQGNCTSEVLPEFLNKLVLSKSTKDHTVGACIVSGDEENDILGFTKYPLHTLPNTHYADLLATQYISLMLRDGYQLIHDEIQPILDCSAGACSSQATLTNDLPRSGVLLPPSPSPISGWSISAVTPISNNLSSLGSRHLPSNNFLPSAHMLPPSTLQAIQHAVPTHLTDVQDQHSQFRRSTALAGNNYIVNTNMQTINVSDPALIRHQFQQRLHPFQHQQSIMQRKLMVGGLSAAASMENIGAMQPSCGSPGLENIVGFSTTNNAGMGISMSESMGGPVPGMRNLGQLNHLDEVSTFGSLNQLLHSGGICPAEVAALTKLMLLHNRGPGVLGSGPIRNMLEGVDGMVGSGLANDGSMFNQTLGRRSLVQLQRPGMVSMGPVGASTMNLHMDNQHHQQQTQQQPQKNQQIQYQQLQRPQQLQLLQQLEQQQHMGSLLLQSQVGLREQVVSTSTHVSPQQIGIQNTMSPQQLSSGATS